MSNFKKKIIEFLKRFWSILRASKLNMSIFISACIVVILTITIVILIIDNGGVNNQYVINNTTIIEVNNSTDATEQTTENTTAATEIEEYTTEINIDDNGKMVSSFSKLSAKIKIDKTWNNNNDNYTQYVVELSNISNNDIDGYAYRVNFKNNFNLVDSWNMTAKSEGLKIVGIPNNDYKLLKTGDKLKAGFVLKSDRYIVAESITLYVGDLVETVSLNVSVPPAETTDDKQTTEESTVESEEDNTENNTEESESDSELETNDSTSEENSSIETTSPEESSPENESQQDSTLESTSDASESSNIENTDESEETTTPASSEESETTTSIEATT